MRALDTPEALIARVRLVDDAYRDFSVDPAEAAANYGIRGELMTELLDRGLPVRGGPDGPRLDGYDLANIALHLGLSSMQRRAVVAWRQTLLAGTALPVARYVLAYAGECARPGHAGPCDIRFTLPVGARAVGGDGTVVEVERPTTWPQLPPEVEQVADALVDLWFFALPPALRDDVGFARTSRLAGCGMAARLVEDECRAAGLVVSPRSGLLLSVPFSTWHNWVDVRVTDRWVPFDPHLIRMMTRHGGLDAREWPPVRSPGALLAASGDGARELAHHGTDPAAATVTTRLVPA